MKKWLSIFLILVTMAGNFFPCCMDDDCQDEPTTQSENHHNEHQEKGPCSPFFACGTCAAALEVTANNIFIADPLSPNINHTSVYLFQLGRYSASFFQPPRQS